MNASAENALSSVARRCREEIIAATAGKPISEHDKIHSALLDKHAKSITARYVSSQALAKFLRAAGGYRDTSMLIGYVLLFLTKVAMPVRMTFTLPTFSASRLLSSTRNHIRLPSLRAAKFTNSLDLEPGNGEIAWAN